MPRPRFGEDLNRIPKIAAAMRAASGFEARLSLIERALGALGATAVNVAALDRLAVVPPGSIASPSQHAHDPYRGGHRRQDPIARHAAPGKTPLV